jgi:hypothetical protein
MERLPRSLGRMAAPHSSVTPNPFFLKGFLRLIMPWVTAIRQGRAAILLIKEDWWEYELNMG